MLTCYFTRRRLSAYLDGTLDGHAASAAATHLAGCARCQREADGLRRLRTTLQQGAATAAPPDWTGFWPGIVRGVDDRRREVPTRPTWGWSRVLRRPRLAFGGAVATALVASLTLWQAFYAPVAPEAAVVVSANTEHPDGTVMVYSPPERDLAVVWVFGLD